MCEGKTPLCRGSRGSIERQQNAIRCVASFSSNSLCRFCHFRGRFACTHTHEIWRLDCVCFRAFRAQWVSTISAVSSHETRLYVSAGCHLPLATLSPFLLPLPAPLPPAKIRCLHFIWIWIWGLILRVAEEWGGWKVTGEVLDVLVRAAWPPSWHDLPLGKCVCVHASTQWHVVTETDWQALCSSTPTTAERLMMTSLRPYTLLSFSPPPSLTHTHTHWNTHTHDVFLSLTLFVLCFSPSTTSSSITRPHRQWHPVYCLPDAKAQTLAHTHSNQLTHLNSCPQSY